MYTLAVRRDFIARHFLIGGDWGPENNPNSHHYVLELRLKGQELDQHGYLCDIVDVEHCTRLDAFPFAMPVTREQGRPVLRALQV